MEEETNTNKMNNQFIQLCNSLFLKGTWIIKLDGGYVIDFREILWSSVYHFDPLY